MLARLLKQHFYQPVEVSLCCTYVDSQITSFADGNRPAHARVRPTLFGRPLHPAQLGERGSKVIEHHRNGSAELGLLVRLPIRDVPLRLVDSEDPIVTPLCRDVNPLDIY